MRTISNMLRLPNLLIIALTFLFLRYLVFIPVYTANSMASGMGSFNFLLMVTTTILIAAAGYISNDYFDVVTDNVNKPEKQYIGKIISPGSAFATAILLSIVAIVFSIWLTLDVKKWLPVALLLSALAVTWWYALRLKKSFLWGNIAVSCMSAGTIAMAWLIEKQCSQVPDKPSGIITSIIVAISIFAFLLSLLREILKDIEDIEGDRLIHCRSLPIIKGVKFTKVIVLLISGILLLLLLIAQVYLLEFARYPAAIWLLFSVEIPLFYFLRALKKADEKADFHKLSALLKWIMLGGIGTIIAGQF